MPEQRPDWLPMVEWQAYLDMRKKIKKPLTGYGQGLALRMLEKLKDAGHQPAEVLEQSIFQSWQGLFPVREIKGLEVAKEDKKTMPGRCPKCGCGSKLHGEKRECKGCGWLFT